MATLNFGRGKHRKYLPLVFTEEGVAMLSGVLKSEQAIEVNIAIMRAFVQFRHTAGPYTELRAELGDLKKEIRDLLQKGDVQSKALLDSDQELKICEIPPKVQHRAREMQSHKKGILPEVDEILKTVARYFGLTVLDLKSSCRVDRIALGRQIAMYLVRKETGVGLKFIGSKFGGKDHTTVLHACRKIEAMRVSNINIRLAVESIERFILKSSGVK